MLCASLAGANQVIADELDEMLLTDELGEEGIFEDHELPVVLTATRLRQPRAEVPASVTIIEAQQIEAWGVRTLPDLMRFVPGMFIGHGDDENNASVAYHAGAPSVSRRLQVLVDGRSVYRAAIASVTWNDIPVALEDIQRIEVTRGPSSATYGSNSFQGVINIITKHPGDSLGTQLRYRNGNNGVDDGYLSHSWLAGGAAWRVTGQVSASDGFDGSDRNSHSDQYRDGVRHGFVSLARNQTFDSGWVLQTLASYKAGHTDIRQNDLYTSAPDVDSRQGMVLAKLSKDFDVDHSAYVRGYWQREVRESSATVNPYTLMIDPALFDLYRYNNTLADGFVYELQNLIGEVYAGTVAASDAQSELMQRLMGYGLDTTGMGYIGQILANTGGDLSLLTQRTEGTIENTSRDERFDIEIQDTRRWTESLRTVMGLNLRRDQVYSRTYFDGTVKNDTYRLFGNLEYWLLDDLLLNAGGTWEKEDANDSVFSPRIGLNYLITPQQSVRLIHSRATRSPDLLEQNPNFQIDVTGLNDNYLNVDEGTFYLHQWPGARDLDHERISSLELGYYGRFNEPGIELDVKIFREHMENLITDPINIQTLELNANTHMDIEGVEVQLNWEATAKDWLWLTAAYINVDVEGEDTIEPDGDVYRSYLTDTRLSAQNSLVASWSHREENWSLTGSYFWYDAYNQYAKSKDNSYRRAEVNFKVFDRIGKYQPSLGFFVHHVIDSNPLIYSNQRYNTSNLFYVQAGINF